MGVLRGIIEDNLQRAKEKRERTNEIFFSERDTWIQLEVVPGGNTGKKNGERVI